MTDDATTSATSAADSQSSDFWEKVRRTAPGPDEEIPFSEGKKTHPRRRRAASFALFAVAAACALGALAMYPDVDGLSAASVGLLFIGLMLMLSPRETPASEFGGVDAFVGVLLLAVLIAASSLLAVAFAGNLLLLGTLGLMTICSIVSWVLDFSSGLANIVG